MAGPDRARRAFIFLAVLFLALSGTAMGQAAAEPPVDVDVGVVLASNEGSGVDPALSAIREKLQSMFSYKSYRMLDRISRSMPVGATDAFGLPGNRTMRLTPISSAGDKVRLAVQITEGQKTLLTTTLGLSRGGMVLVGGPSYRNGTLILVISAK